MDLQGIADFIAIAELRSFSKAANARNVTQPAFSRRIKALEESLNVSLINRSTTPLSLTAAGERFLRHAQSLTGMVSSISTDMQAMATKLPKAVHIEMSNSLSSVFFPVWYKAMQRKVRGLTFRLSHQRSTVSIEDLRSARADFVVHAAVKGFRRSYDYTNIREQTIGHDEFVFVKAASLKNDTTSLITHRVGSYLNACIERALSPSRLKKMKVTFESPNSEFSRGMALAGFGTALLPKNLVIDDLRDGYLIPAMTDIKPMPTEIMLLRADRQLSPLAEALWEKSRID